MSSATDSQAAKALELFRQHGGTLRTKEALALGIHPRTLYALRDAGDLERLSRGLYRLAELPPLAEPDLVIVAERAPDAVICLISALAFHGLTTQIPHVVDLAVARGSAAPEITFPPIRVFWFSGPAWREGVETHLSDGTQLHIYSPEKTIADSFKYRRKLGLDIVLEGLATYTARPNADVDALLRYAKVCRVGNVMRPYLEASL
jgi:predicted transcriptional regulator of viral defense system